MKNVKETGKARRPFFKNLTIAALAGLLVLSARGCAAQNSAEAPNADVLGISEYAIEEDSDNSVEEVETTAVEETAVEETASVAPQVIYVPGETRVETVEVPGETKVVTVPGETKTETIVKTVEVPGETIVKTVEVPGETIVKTIEVPGETIVKTVVEEHKYHSSIKDATCTETGVITYSCDECGDSYQETISAKGHNYAVDSVVSVDNGVLVTFKCTSCGKSYDELVEVGKEAHTHDFVVVDHKDASCEADGYDVYTCECGETYTEVIKANGHSFGEWVVTTPATEDTDAIETRTCEVCGKTEDRNVDGSQIEKHEHNFVEVSRTEATCTEDGVVVYECECGEAKTEVIPATGHNFSDWVVTTPATEDTDAVETRTCEDCGATEDRNVDGSQIEKHEHNFVEVSRTEATCTEDGVVVYECECGETKTEVIPATGHNFSDWVYNNDATEDADGTETRVCENCGEEETRTAEDTKLQPSTDWKAATLVEFNEFGWGFYTNLDGEEICTTRGAYKDYLATNYPELTICEDGNCVWAE